MRAQFLLYEASGQFDVGVHIARDPRARRLGARAAASDTRDGIQTPATGEIAHAGILECFLTTVEVARRLRSEKNLFVRDRNSHPSRGGTSSTAARVELPGAPHARITEANEWQLRLPQELPPDAQFHALNDPWCIVGEGGQGLWDARACENEAPEAMWLNDLQGLQHCGEQMLFGRLGSRHGLEAPSIQDQIDLTGCEIQFLECRH